MHCGNQRNQRGRVVHKSGAGYVRGRSADLKCRSGLEMPDRKRQMAGLSPYRTLHGQKWPLVGNANPMKLVITQATQSGS